MPVILKVLEGPDAGQHVTLSQGETVVGTGTRAALRLTTKTASVEHFVVTQGADSYFIENLSARGTLVNDNKISGKMKLRLRDKIRVSEDTVIRLETEGGDSLLTQYRSVAIVLVVLLALVGMYMLIYNPFATPEPEEDWNETQRALTRFVQKSDYPANVKRVWEVAWDRDQAAYNADKPKDYKAVELQWLALWDALSAKGQIVNADETKKLFKKLLKAPDKDAFLTDNYGNVHELLMYFVSRRRDQAVRKAEEARGILD